MKKCLKIGIPVLMGLVIGFIYYYINLPAINIHSKGFWGFLLFLALVITAAAGLFVMKKQNTHFQNNVVPISKVLFKNKLLFSCIAITLALLLIYIFGSLLSSPIVNAKKY